MKLQAQSTWIGAAAAQWDIAGNWSPTGVPNSVNAVVNWTNGVQPYLNTGGPFIVGALNFLYGGSLGFGSNNGNDLLSAQTSGGTPTFYVTNGGNVYFYVVLSGTQGLNKTGPGTLTFRYNSSTQPFSGNIAILGGTLGIQADYSLGNTANNLLITNGGSLSESSGANGGVFWLSPARTITLAGPQAQLAVNTSAYTLVVPCLINENPAGSGLLWGSAGELVLSNANTFTGPMTMTAGTNDLANANAVQFATMTVNGGTLLLDKAVAANSFTLGGLSGTSNVALQNTAATPAPIALTVGGNNATTTFAGNLTGPGSLIKAGSGTLTLAGANAYTGNTTVAAGRLVTSAASTGAGAVSVADGATNQVLVGTAGQTLTNRSLTLGASAGATVEFNNSIPGSPTSPMLVVSNLTLNGTTKVNVYGPDFAYSVGTITLLAYGSKSGRGGWALNALPSGVVASLNDTGAQLQLIITSVSYPTVSETVSFSSSNAGYAINPAFCGLSYEKSDLTGHLFVASDTSLISMFSQITPGVLRIGGNTVDTTCWGGVSNLTAITPAQVDAFAGFVKALPANWRVLYGINLVVNSPTNCAAEAAYVANALGSRLLGFEIGNEPDLYHDNTNYFPSNYSYANFLPTWRALAAGITNGVPGWAVTNGGNGWTLTGPASSYNTSGYTLPFVTNEAGVISMVTQHYYRNSGTAANATMAVLLTLDANLPVIVSNLVHAATAYNLPQGFRMDESGSFSGGGNTNSSQYGAALWSLDVMLTEAVNGCQGVNFHGGGDGASSYTPIADNGTSVVQARPEFYGLKLFSLASQGSAIAASLTPSPTVNFSAYGIRQTNAAVSAILINKEASTGVQVTVNLGTNVAAAQTMTLIGPALNATNGYTLGGVTINPDGSWSGGFQSVIPATNGQLTITVLPMSAVWLNPLLAPTLAPIANYAIIAGTNFAVASRAGDSNSPPQSLGFTLSMAPAGAGINPSTGLVNWRPLIAQSGTSNQFTVVVTNTVSLAATQSFWVGVIAPQAPVMSAPNVLAGQFGFTISGSTGPDYIIQATTNLASPVWQPISTVLAPVPPFQWADTNNLNSQWYYRVLLGP